MKKKFENYDYDFTIEEKTNFEIMYKILTDLQIKRLERDRA